MGLALAPNNLIANFMNFIRFFHHLPTSMQSIERKWKATYRIGPHKKQVLSLLVGNLLSNSWGEKRYNSSRFHIYIESKQIEYLYWLHKIYSQAGYCNPKRPEINHRIEKGNKLRYVILFRLYSFSSLNWLYDAFYVDKVKRVPPQIGEWLDAQALAFWLMDNGGPIGSGVSLATNSFTLQDVQLLQKVLKQNFNLSVNLHRDKNQCKLYFPKNQITTLSQLVKPYMISSMYYKIHE